jgi:hypothetical protein
MKLAAALLTRPVSGPPAQILSTMASICVGFAHVADVVLHAAAVLRGGAQFVDRGLQHAFTPATDEDRGAMGDEVARQFLAEPGATARDEDALAGEHVGAEGRGRVHASFRPG